MRTTPADGRALASTGRWVSDAGCCTSESMPPSDTAWVISSQASVKRTAASIAAGEVEGDQRSGAGRLAADQAGRVLARQAGVEHPVEGRVADEAAGNLAGGVLLGAHAHRQRAEAAVQQVRRERVQQAAGEGAHLAQAHDPLGRAGHRAAHDVAVTAEVLRGAVQNQGRARLNRALQHGRGECVVDEHRNAARRIHDRADVGELERGVRRRFENDQSGVGANRGGDAGNVGPGDLGAEQPGGQNVVGSAVEGTQRDDVRSLARQRRRSARR